MLLEKKQPTFALIVILLFLAITGAAQVPNARVDKSKLDVSDKSLADNPVSDPPAEETEAGDILQSPGDFQSNGLLVDSAYHEDESQLQHQFIFFRTNLHSWSSEFAEEVVLVKDRHQ